MPRINQYPVVTPLAEDDDLLVWDTSASRTGRGPAGAAAKLARGVWQRRVETAGLGTPLAIPWEAAPQRLDEILTELPAALTVTLWRLDGSTETATRDGGAWNGNDGAKQITPGCGLSLALGSGYATVTCQLTGDSRPTELVLPATADAAHALYVTNPLPRWRGVREIFVDVDEWVEPGLTVALMFSASSLIEWTHPGYGVGTGSQFRVPPGALLKVYSNPTQALTLQWNRDDVPGKYWGLYDAEENAYLAQRDPTPDDGVTFQPGVIWINLVTQAAFLCVARNASGIAVWKPIG